MPSQSSQRSRQLGFLMFIHRFFSLFPTFLTNGNLFDILHVSVLAQFKSTIGFPLDLNSTLNEIVIFEFPPTKVRLDGLFGVLPHGVICISNKHEIIHMSRNEYLPQPKANNKGHSNIVENQETRNMLEQFHTIHKGLEQIHNRFSSNALHFLLAPQSLVQLGSWNAKQIFGTFPSLKEYRCHIAFPGVPSPTWRLLQHQLSSVSSSGRCVCCGKLIAGVLISQNHNSGRGDGVTVTIDFPSQQPAHSHCHLFRWLEV